MWVGPRHLPYDHALVDAKVGFTEADTTLTCTNIEGGTEGASRRLDEGRDPTPREHQGARRLQQGYDGGMSVVPAFSARHDLAWQYVQGDLARI